MRSDNIEPVPPWVHWDKTWTAADPLTVTEPDPLTRDRSRDVALVCLAGMVIIAILAYLAGRASA